MTRTLGPAEARRITLGAQGFSRRLPTAVGPRRLHSTMERLGVLQIDSVNVFARAHYMPMFSRLGGYDPALFDRVFLTGSTHYVEYVPHEAAFVTTADWALWRFRMNDFRRKWEGDPDSWLNANERTVDWVRAELRDRGPLRPADLRDDGQRGRAGWWEWDDVKLALEVLWRLGEVAVPARRGFERTYALATEVIPAPVLAREVSREDAVRELVHRAARSYGVATEGDLADYYRIRDRRQVRAAIAALEDEGSLIPVAVRGWERGGSGRGGGRGLRAWLHRDAVIPRRIDRAALLSPFDPVVWFRERALRLFGLDYRIEIYTPARQRRFGYYSLPVLVGDRIVARVDLKADRARSELLVQSAWWERPVVGDWIGAEHRASTATGPGAVAEAIATELARAASWQSLERISVSGWGDAAEAIAQALRGRGSSVHRHRHPRESPGSAAHAKPRPPGTSPPRPS